MLAGIREALVNVIGAGGSSKSWGTGAVVSSRVVFTGGAIETGFREAFINIRGTGRATPLGRAGTHVPPEAVVAGGAVETAPIRGHALVHIALAPEALPSGHTRAVVGSRVVIARPPMLARSGGALVDVRGAGGPGVSTGTGAAVCPRGVGAGGSIQTRSREALVDVSFA